MKFFETKTDCLQYALAEISATLRDDLDRMRADDSGDYCSDDIKILADKISDIESIEAEAIEALEKYLGPESPHLLRVENPSNGQAFNVRLVKVGQRYGREDCLTLEPSKHGALIEFFAITENIETSFKKMGYFVSRYYISTLEESPNNLPTTGLCLEGSAPEFNVDPETMRMIFMWLQVLRATGEEI